MVTQLTLYISQSRLGLLEHDLSLCVYELPGYRCQWHCSHTSTVVLGKVMQGLVFLLELVEAIQDPHMLSNFIY